MAKKQLKMKVVAGQPSWCIRSSTVEACVTRQGGHLGPVVFDRRSKPIKPFAVAPWANETDLPPKLPDMLRVLRGDFFCMPFGGNEKPWQGERHPPHGETANRPWSFESLTKTGPVTELSLSMKTRARPAKVVKTLRLIDRHDVLYQTHTITGGSGPINVGHHAMLQFPTDGRTGLLSTSPFVYGQVFPSAFERPELGGYQSLKPGAEFQSLSAVPKIDGTTADLSVYPARRGFEDLVTIVHDDAQRFAWNAVVFPDDGYVWFSLKDPKVLRQTILWHSNGGRHYAPWNGRHIGVLGIEDVTSYFHDGLAASANPNPFSRAGSPTTVKLSPKVPTVVRYVMGVARVARGSLAVSDVKVDENGIILMSEDTVLARVPLDRGFLDRA